MKHLEAIGLVQYFLYERLDLELGRNTAFLGPNGTGKTALLDALQIVLLAADSNKTHFNASGEGKKRSRTLRDYCLGVFGQTGQERYRSASNTYIDLVFRDPATGIPVTAGVSLAAQDDATDVAFNGLYILPGVAFHTENHIEREGTRDVVLPWRRFQQLAADECRMAGTTALFTTNRDEFSRHLYIEHLASPGERPNTRSIRSAFARSLKLNKDVTDLSETLRDHLVEERLTNVKLFRSRLQQFRDMRELVRQVKERIERVTEVVDKYAIVDRERKVEANVTCLQAVYETEQVAEQLAEAEETVERLGSEQDAVSAELRRATQEVSLAESSRDRALEARNQDADYLKQGGSVSRLNELDGDWKERRGELGKATDLVVWAVTDAGRHPLLANDPAMFEEALACLAPLTAAVQSGTTPASTEVLAAGQAVADVHGLVSKALSAAETELAAADAARRDARKALERAKSGYRPARDEVLALQRLLDEAGIECTPVSDLVRVKDDAWQPALEAYLGHHCDALLIPREQELAAIDLYKGLRGARTVYGVKLALPSRGKPWQASGGGRFAAQLIEGDDRDAVWYLQGTLGRLSLAESSNELQVGARALSREGMVASGGGVERLRLPAVSELRVGRVNTATLQQDADRALRRAEEAFTPAERNVRELKVALQALALFADAASTQEGIERLFVRESEARRLRDDLSTRVAAAQSGTLGSLMDAVEKATLRRDEAREYEKTLTGKLGGLDTGIKTARARAESLDVRLGYVRNHEQACRMLPLYNANEVDRYRLRFDEQHGDDLDLKLQKCKARIEKAAGTANIAQGDAWVRFAQYAADFSLQNHDLKSDQWQRVRQYVLADRQRMEDLELVEREAQTEEAYDAAVKVFRNDVAHVLLEGFDAIEEQISSLNQILKAAPEFSNGERYQFRFVPVEQHRSLYEFLRRVRQMTSAEDDMFAGAGQLPAEFRELVEGDIDSVLLQDGSPLNDHRRFFAYDVEIFHDGKSMGWLSKRFGPGSGGEHRTPLYVIFGAALAAAYGKSRTTSTPGGIIMLDEAFEKMDAQNVRATADYLNALGLQLIMAGPETDQPKMSSFLNVYYDMARFGSRNVQMTRNVVLDEARELLHSDNYLLHPELLKQEMEALAGGNDDVR